MDVHYPNGTVSRGHVSPSHGQVLLLHNRAQGFLASQGQLTSEGQIQQAIPVEVPLQWTHVLLVICGDQRGAGPSKDFDGTFPEAGRLLPLVPALSSDHWPGPQHGSFSQVRVPGLTGTSCLFKLLEELLGLRCDEEYTLVSRGAMGTRGLRLEAGADPVLQGWGDSDWWHPSLLIRATQEALSILGVYFPKAAFAWFILLPRHLDEALVE